MREGEEIIFMREGEAYIRLKVNTQPPSVARGSRCDAQLHVTTVIMACITPSLKCVIQSPRACRLCGVIQTINLTIRRHNKNILRIQLITNPDQVTTQCREPISP